MKKIDDVDAVGWKFFAAMSVVFAPPSAWLMLKITTDEAPMIERVMLGVAVGALLAAITAWVVNELLHQRNVRRFEAEKKAEKKEKKKKNHH